MQGGQEIEGDWNSGWRPAGWVGTVHPSEYLLNGIENDIEELQHTVLYGEPDFIPGRMDPQQQQQHARRRGAAHTRPEERKRHRRLSNLMREHNDLAPLVDEEQLRMDNWTHNPGDHTPQDQVSAVTKDAMLAYRAAHIGRSLAREDVAPEAHSPLPQSPATVGYGSYCVPGVNYNGSRDSADRYELTQLCNTTLTPRVKEAQQEALDQLTRDMGEAYKRGKLGNQKHVGKVHVGARGGRFVVTSAGRRRYLH